MASTLIVVLPGCSRWRTGWSQQRRPLTGGVGREGQIARDVHDPVHRQGLAQQLGDPGAVLDGPGDGDHAVVAGEPSVTVTAGVRLSASPGSALAFLRIRPPPSTSNGAPLIRRVPGLGSRSLMQTMPVTRCSWSTAGTASTRKRRRALTTS